jgi:hypothetical protein
MDVEGATGDAVAADTGNVSGLRTFHYRLGLTREGRVRVEGGAVDALTEALDHETARPIERSEWRMTIVKEVAGDPVLDDRRGIVAGLRSGPIDAFSLRQYMTDTLGRDMRTVMTTYDDWARVLGDLGIRSLDVLHQMIGDLDSVALSQTLWKVKRSQMQRFELLLLVALGDHYITAHPSADDLQFVENRRVWLRDLVRRGVEVGRRWPPIQGEAPNSPDA